MRNSGRQHFGMKVEGLYFVYVYIRKNACSSWKHFFINESTAKKTDADRENPLRFMERHHRVRSVQSIRAAPNRIVVLREPVERVVSGFLNQYVMRLKRGSGVHDDVTSRTQVACHDVTFRQFLDQYLLDSCPNELNPHFYTQASHLADVDYNRVWLMDKLEDEVRGVFGSRIAETYFARRTNATSHIPKYEHPAMDVTAGALYLEWKRSGVLPSKKALAPKELAGKIRSYYEEDVRLYKKARKDASKSFF